jgi:hypothetical protein
MTLHETAEGKGGIMIDNPSFWPDGARLAISISLMYEGGGQPLGQIADWAMKTRRQTPYLDRGSVTKTGLSGPAE